MIRLLRRASKGQVLVLLAVVVLVLFGIVALALDLGMAYGVKAKLDAAADAAALAALTERTSGTGTDVSAKAVGTDYFYANFPAESMGVPRPTCKLELSSTETALVASVSANTVMPTYVAKAIGWKGLSIGTKCEATRSSLDLALVLDTTTSLAGVFDQVKGRASDFLDRFSENYDRVALVPFASGVAVKDKGGELVLTDGEDIDKTSRKFNKSQIKGKIGNLNADGTTSSELAIRIGINQLGKVSNPAARRAIVFFSDGSPNGFTANVPVDASHTVSGTIYSGIYDSETPEILDPEYRKKNKKNASIYKVPATSGGNYIGSVQLLPQLPVTSKQREIYFYDNTSPKDLRCDANKAARNALENIAEYARSQGIIVFSLGYGDRLDQHETSIGCSTDKEVGSTIMRRVANTIDSDTYNPSQPTGIYCHAATVDRLGPCFNAIANSLLRLTK